MKYRKIPIISPGPIFVQKAFLMALFSGELIFGAAYYWKAFYVSEWVGLDNKNSLKHYGNSLKQIKTASINSPWAYIRKGALSEGFLRLRFEGGAFLGGGGRGVIARILRVFGNKEVKILFCVR